MLLPNADQAIIDDQKLTGYVLNPEHEEGKHKAFVFKSVLGITASDADEMTAQILLEIFRNPVQTGREDKQVSDIPLNLTGPALAEQLPY